MITYQNILIVSNDAKSTALARAHLEQGPDPSHCTVAATGESGLLALRAGEFACVLLDQEPSGMTALAFLGAFGRTGPPCAVVVLCDSEDLDGAIKAGFLRAGAEDLIIKSRLDAETLRRTVSSAAVRFGLHHRLEREISSSATILDLVPGIVYAFDPMTGASTYLNHTISEALGYEPDAVLAQGPDFAQRAMHPEDRQWLAAHLERLAATGESLEFEYRMLHRDGSWRWFLSRDAFHARPGKPSGLVVGIATDVTDLRLLQEDLQESGSRYRTLMESVDQGFATCEMIFDADGRPHDYRFLEVNARFAHETGLPSATGRTLRELVPGIEQQWFDNYGRVISSGKPARFEMAANALDRWFTVYARRVGGPGSACFSILFEDITYRHRADVRLRGLQLVTSRLAQVQTLAEVRRVLLSEGLAAIGADAGSLRLVTSEGLTLEEYQLGPRYGEEVAEKLSRVPLGADHPAAEVARTGEPVFVHDAAEFALRYPEVVMILAPHVTYATAQLPLKRYGEVFAVLSLGFAEPHDWDEDERAFVVAVAEQTAVSCERARLFEDERRAKERVERLQALTVQLAIALTPADVVRAVLEDALPALGADAGVVVRLKGDDLEVVGSVGYPETLVRPWMHFPLSTSVPLAEAARNLRAVWIGSLLEFHQRYPVFQPAPSSQTDSAAWVSLPLVAHGQTLGALGISYNQAQTFDPETREYAEKLASLCSFALERAALHEAVLNTETRLQFVLSSSGIGLWDWDIAAGRIVWSLEQERLYGLEPGTFGGTLADFEAFVHPDDRALMGEHIITLEAGVTASIDFRIVLHDGEVRHVHVVSCPITGLRKAENRVIGVTIDMTMHRRLEERLIETNQAQQRFVSDASHELRAPLTSITGNLELLERYPQMLPEDRSETLAEATAEAGRMVRLINHMLNAARGEKNEPIHEAIKLETALQGAWRVSLSLSDRRVFELGTLEPALVIGDADALKQLAVILLENAIKYSPDGGMVRLESKVVGEQVEFTVSNTGPCIPASDLPHLFDRFYRADLARTHVKDPGGTGLGLTIAQRITDDHGGEISVSSDLETGTRFTVRLPVASSSIIEALLNNTE